MALQLEVASPCGEPWDAMRGDARSRFCQRCRLTSSTSALTEAELRALLAQNGLVCGRFFRRRDGTVLTRDCPTGMRQRRVRLVRGLLAAAGLLLGLVASRTPRSPSPCATQTDPSFFTRAALVVEGRVLEAREALRETSLRPLVDWLFPPSPVMGRMTMVRVVRDDPAD